MLSLPDRRIPALWTSSRLRLAKIICSGFRNLDCEISLAISYALVLGWLDVHRRVNRGGIFDSPFSERVGISEPSIDGGDRLHEVRDL
jgi:hypothetical protein